MPLDGARDFFDRLEARSDRPAVPAIENELGPISGGAPVDILEREPDPIGARCFKVHAAERLERWALLNGEPAFVHQPKVSAVLELGPILALGAADQVDGIVDQFDGVKL